MKRFRNIKQMNLKLEIERLSSECNIKADKLHLTVVSACLSSTLVAFFFLIILY